MANYTQKIKLICKGLYCESPWLTPEQISERFGNEPAATTVRYWIKQEGWEDIRRENSDMEYTQMNPAAMARMLEKRMVQILNSKEGNIGDDLRKVVSAYRDIVDPRKQFVSKFHAIDELLEHITKKFKKEVVAPHVEFLSMALQSYRDELRRQIEES